MCQEVVMEGMKNLKKKKLRGVENQKPIYVTLARVGQKRWDGGTEIFVGTESESLPQS